MEYSVLRIVEGVGGGADSIELIARFPTLKEARRVAMSAQQNSLSRNEFLVSPDPELLIAVAKGYLSAS